jgi:hypothetical protein
MGVLWSHTSFPLGAYHKTQPAVQPQGFLSPFLNIIIAGNDHYPKACKSVLQMYDLNIAVTDGMIMRQSKDQYYVDFPSAFSLRI